ncbi:CALM [Mytilus edulis]|uniref:CALM n=1 Tax=Mytilus edulis TaxID=6550 RepID=A0A8S3TYE7_MYTED|nr:CALM [Mytilus edulis]
MAMTEDQLKELEETFLIFDKTGDQELDVEEAGRMWRSTGLNPTKSEIQEMFNEIDQDGRGTIDCKEFISWMSTNGNKNFVDNLEEEMREAFRVFDKNGDGFLDKKEFKRIMTELGDEPLTSEELENLMGKYDEDGDEKISYEEFIPGFVEMARNRDAFEEQENDEETNNGNEY